MIPLVAQHRVAFVILHMQGTPRTMQMDPDYTDVVSEVADFFRQQYLRALECGVDPMAIAFDPGIGFGKTLEHNLELLAQLHRLRVNDRPLVIGVSRKSFLAKVRARGADVFRVHDIKENVNALRITEAILQRTK
jgi:dihydropteroate synthase